MSAARTVLCMKWGTKYGPEYVNRLYAMVRRHLRGEFRFVCLTDRSEGVRAEVQCLPIPELALPEGIPERGWKSSPPLPPTCTACKAPRSSLTWTW